MRCFVALVLVACCSVVRADSPEFEQSSVNWAACAWAESDMYHSNVKESHEYMPDEVLGVYSYPPDITDKATADADQLWANPSYEVDSRAVLNPTMTESLLGDYPQVALTGSLRAYGYAADTSRGGYMKSSVSGWLSNTIHINETSPVWVKGYMYISASGNNSSSPGVSIKHSIQLIAFYQDGQCIVATFNPTGSYWSWVKQYYASENQWANDQYTYLTGTTQNDSDPTDLSISCYCYSKKWVGFPRPVTHGAIINQQGNPQGNLATWGPKGINYSFGGATDPQTINLTHYFTIKSNVVDMYFDNTQ